MASQAVILVLEDYFCVYRSRHLQEIENSSSSSKTVSQKLQRSLQNSESRFIFICRAAVIKTRKRKRKSCFAGKLTPTCCSIASKTHYDGAHLAAM